MTRLRKIGVCMFGVAVAACGVRAQQPPEAAAPERIRQLIASLPANSPWRNMLEHGMRGDGVHQPWMDQMRKDGVKIAKLTFEFVWRQRGWKLENWTLAAEEYFRDYDEVQPVAEPRQLELIREDGLGEELAAALPLAKKGNWVHQPSKERGEGFRVVVLADNEWLPVNLPPRFQH